MADERSIFEDVAGTESAKVVPTPVAPPAGIAQRAAAKTTQSHPGRVSSDTPAQPPKPPPSPKPRVSVVVQVAHQGPKTGATTGNGRWGRFIESDEQPFVRMAKVGETWEPIQLGWLTAASVFYIENREGRFAVIPTQQEKDEMAQRVIEIGVCLEGTEQVIPTQEIRPGEGLPVQPLDVSKYRIRCRHGNAEYCTKVFPK